MDDKRAHVRQLAAEFAQKGNPLGWFEALYAEAGSDHSVIPWADMEPNPGLVEFWRKNPLETAGKCALVIGCGFGDDSEQLSMWGFETTAFDISPTAIAATTKRYPNSKVVYAVADLFAPLSGWTRAFDFVLEVFTVQAFQGDLRAKAVAKIAEFVAPGGELLVVTRGRAADEPEGQGPPWPLTREEIDGFLRAGLAEQSFEDYPDPEPPWVRRFRALYRRP
ncbi:MAG: methyltransferase domain-containing protein [Candidatus Acidiferrales bacterium]